jgi:folate-dependent phosphoribosylglycinamide formyltransferase PurN
MNIGVLASHDGSILQVVLDACAECRISGRVAVVISNNGGARALERARQAGVLAVPSLSQAGETETGISIHHVEFQYDSGAPIAQCRVPVRRDDSVETLKAPRPRCP